MKGHGKKKFFFEVKEYAQEDYPYLADMYDVFVPKGKFQGIPPCDNDTCSIWLRHVTDNGKNFVAYIKGGNRIVGHVALLPDFDRLDAEYLAFVVQSYRGKGVGSKLTQQAIKWCRRNGIKIIWLMVDAHNFRAIRLYRKHGFYFPKPVDCMSERLMVLKL